jgi:hypothetical protein
MFYKTSLLAKYRVFASFDWFKPPPIAYPVEEVSSAWVSAMVSSKDSQLFLFSKTDQQNFSPAGVEQPSSLALDAESLTGWQGSLFDTTRTVADPEAIDPFYLQLYNFFFFEWPASRHPSEPCIYFVIDTTVPLLLYVGETCKANKRWKGVHDCKRYALNYQEAHYRLGIPTTINTAFYWDTPGDVRPRQQLELALILKWRSPFNKENWQFWGTPFVN